MVCYLILLALKDLSYFSFNLWQNIKQTCSVKLTKKIQNGRV